MSKILIADDDTLLADSLLSYLKNKGFDAKSVSNGNEVIKEFEEFNPDIMLLDIMMPGKTGIEILKELKEKDQKSISKIMMLTSMDGQTYLAEALECGLKNYISKIDLTPESVISLIESELAKDEKYR